MPVIYFDNFRGFEKTFLPLESINFFIGENSTGKTSVLKLIQILSSPQFWILNEFSSNEFELGYFNEITSKNDSKRRDFEVGILGDSKDKEKKISAIRMKFVEEDGLPSISDVYLIDGGYNVHVRKDGAELKYRFSEINISSITEETKLKYFKKWIEKSNLENKAFSSVPFTGGALGRSSLLFQIQYIIEKEIKNPKEEDEEDGFGVELPDFLDSMAWIAPIRTKPKRTYESFRIKFEPEGTHSPFLLRKLLNSDEKDITARVTKVINKFGKDSGLFKKITINPLGGTSKNSPFEILIHVEDKPIKITNVGYGVSQILPLIIEVLARGKGAWFAIQQPEIHLHPRAQAAFGDFIYKSFLLEEKKFIVETHSDFLIDRFRLRLHYYSKENKKRKKKITGQVVFFQKNKSGNTLKTIDLESDGKYPDDTPKEFRKFFLNEKLELLKI